MSILFPGMLQSDTKDRTILERRLLDVDERVAQLQVIIPAGPDGDQKRELEQELRDLLRMRLDLQQRLRPAPAPTAVERERLENARKRHQQLVDQAVRERQQQLEWFIEKMMREGDYTAARLYRQQMLLVREQVEREYS